MDDMDYCNNLIVRLEELLFHELSGCAAWKVELVGVDFIQSRQIDGNTPDEIIRSCIREITAAGLVKEINHAIGGKGVKLELNMKGCRHLPKEIKLKKDGVRPYICPITNMFLDQLIEKLGYETTYLAEVEIDEDKGECRTRSAIYEDEDKIGCVCNWDEE
ncbi:MAG: hypothetical protein JRJ85_14060 [Deltaproteobacteria bacterium]|nr:hypothetical protein [Deltaproteobacteria bacterium]